MYLHRFNLTRFRMNIFARLKLYCNIPISALKIVYRNQFWRLVPLLRINEQRIKVLSAESFLKTYNSSLTIYQYLLSNMMGKRADLYWSSHVHLSKTILRPGSG